MSTFFIFITTVWIAAHVYVGRRLIDASSPRPALRRALWALLLAHLSLGLVARLLRSPSAEPSAFEQALHWAGYIGMGGFALLFILVLFRDLAVAAWWAAEALYKRLKPAASPTHDAPPSSTMSRRAFLVSAPANASLLGAASLGTVAGYHEARTIAQVEHVRVPIKDLHPDLHGLVIAQISDIHVGPTIRADYLRGIVERVNTLGADLIALTGDMVDGRVAEMLGEMSALRDLKSRYGVFYVTGNHEYYWDGPAWVKAAQDLGMRPLINQHITIQHGAAKLAVAGVTDYSTGKRVPGHTSSPEDALKGTQDADFRLLLAHQPRSCYEGAEHGADLQLCGHTHGGQFFPWAIFVGFAHPFIKGLHRFKDMWVYVHRGTGYWGPPMRLGVPPEITRIELVPA
jgi:predicted MPP superfamily phosphohydrolase